MRSLWRLGIWGMSASLALVVAVAAGYSDTGSRRPVATRGDLGAAPKGSAPAIPLRLPEIDAETRRLSDAVRSLTDEREQLVTRIGTLERNLEDVTGAIKRQATPAGVVPAAAAPAPPSANAAKGAVAAPAEPQPADSAKLPVREAEPQPAAAPAPERVANAPSAAPPEEPPATGFGVDIGGAPNFEGLRVLWSSTKTGNAAALEGMRPQVAVRENSKTKGTELRLIVGPIANLEDAARMCATLSTGRRYCQPVAFEGQALPDADTAPPAEHKADKTSQHRPAAKPKPADTTPRVLRFFR
jgi:hypothetical protein